MSALVDKRRRMAFLLLVLGMLYAPAMAGAAEELPSDTAGLLEYLYPIFPSFEAPEGDQKRIDNPTPWHIKVWATNDAEECTYENTSQVCKGHVLYFTISDDELGGKTFGFRTSKAYFWVVRAIRLEAIRKCALIKLSERVPADGKVSANEVWQYIDSEVCVTSDGFVAK